MKYILSRVAVLLLILSTTGCSDFLQKDPVTAPSSATYWTEKAHFDYALASCFSVVYEYPGVLSEIIPCLDNLTDNSICNGDEVTNGRTGSMLRGDITPFNDGYPTVLYTLCYKGIARVQQILAELAEYKGGDISIDQRNFYEAQCHAMRAYYYYWLYLCFKEVPIVTDLLDIKTMYKAKSPRADVKKQLFADFDKAISLMGDQTYHTSGSEGYWTKGAVTALKARVMIYDAYTNGVADAEQMKEVVPVLESITGYELSQNWRSNFISLGQKNNKEIMYSVRYLAPNRTNRMDLHYADWAMIAVGRDLVNAFEFTDGSSWGEGSPLQPVVDEDLLTKIAGTAEARDEYQKLFENRDRRLTESVYHSGRIAFTEPGFATPVTTPISNTNFSLKKVIAPCTQSTVPSYSQLNDPDVVIVRYGHVLLMIAEAENEANGPTGKAYAAINEIRLRAGQPALPAGLSQADFRERVRKEWRVETVAEGLRYFHMKQWNLMDKLNTMSDPVYKVAAVWKPAFIFWPLPQGEIDKAAGLLEQDPAYS